MNQQLKSPSTKTLGALRSLITSFPVLFTISVLVISVSFFFSLYPIGRSPIVEDTIQRVYYADNIADGHSELIRRFNQLHEGEIEVIGIDLPFTKFNTNQRKELIARNLRSRGSRIDVFSVDLVWVPRFTKWAEPIGSYFPLKFLGGLVPEALETCYVNGQLYAIPFYVDIGALFYREDMILALPDGEALNERIQQSISWDELLEITETHFENGPTYLLQGKAYEGLICNFNEILGKSLLDPNTGELTDLTDSIIVERVRFMRDLVQRGVTPSEALNMTEDQCLHYALKYDIPFVRGWPTMDNEGEIQYDPEKFEKLALAPLPHFGDEQATPVFGGWNMMLSKHSPVKEAAILFMQFVSSYEGQRIFYEAEGLLPIQKKIYETETDSLRLKRLNFAASMIRQGIHRPALPEYTLISDILSLHLHEVLKGNVSPEEGLRQAKNEIESLGGGGS